jgi:pimeloyl-[acyl-carrier protein] methyl ester esterase
MKAIALLPGLDGTGLLFGPALDACPDGVRPVVLPLPDLEARSYAELADHLAPRLPKDEPFLLLGESFSGPLALELAARRPDGLAGVVLVASFVTSPVPRGIGRLPWTLAFRVRPPAWAVRFLLTGGDRALAVLVREATASVSSAVLASRVRLAATVDARESLATCRVPVLALAASRDRLVRPRSLAAIRRVRLDVEMRRITGPHLLFQAAPRTVWDTCLAWTSRLETP